MLVLSLNAKIFFSASQSVDGDSNLRGCGNCLFQPCCMHRMRLTSR